MHSEEQQELPGNLEQIVAITTFDSTTAIICSDWRRVDFVYHYDDDDDTIVDEIVASSFLQTSL